MQLTVTVCDACRRAPNGNNPDCVYAPGTHMNPCDRHEVCDRCLDRQRRYLADGRTRVPCRACELEQKAAEREAAKAKAAAQPEWIG